VSHAIVPSTSWPKHALLLSSAHWTIPSAAAQSNSMDDRHIGRSGVQGSGPQQGIMQYSSASQVSSPQATGAPVPSLAGALLDASAPSPEVPDDPLSPAPSPVFVPVSGSSLHATAASATQATQLHTARRPIRWL
jgi:hypothetical protein